MQLTYRAWKATGPTGSRLEQYRRDYIHIPLDGLQEEPIFIHRDTLTTAIINIESKRVGDTFTLLYVRPPGYRSSVLNPNMENWYGGWKFERIKDFQIHQPEEWLRVIGYESFKMNRHIPFCMTLKQFMDAKHSYAWADHCQAVKDGRQPNALNRNIILEAWNAMDEAGL